MDRAVHRRPAGRAPGPARALGRRQHARLGGQHHCLPAPQGHGAGAGATGARRDRLAGRGGGVFSAPRHHPAPEPCAPAARRHGVGAQRGRGRTGGRRLRPVRAHPGGAPRRHTGRALQHSPHRHLPVAPAGPAPGQRQPGRRGSRLHQCPPAAGLLEHAPGRRGRAGVQCPAHRDCVRRHLAGRPRRACAGPPAPPGPACRTGARAARH